MTVTASLEADVANDNGILYEPGSNGDTRHEWNVNNPAEVAAAKAAFKALRKKGHAVYRCDRHGNRAETIHEFDPNAERMVSSPQLVGG